MNATNSTARFGRAVGTALGVSVLAARFIVQPSPRTASRRAGIRLYQSVWNAVNDLFYDRRRLQEFKRLRDKFNKQIQSLADGERFASWLVAGLNDRYTRLCSPEETTLAAASQQDVVCCADSIGGGLGMIVFRSFDVANAAEQLAQSLNKLSDCRGIILDMRGNGGGWVDEALRCCSIFLKEGNLGSEDRCENGRISRRLNFMLTADDIAYLDSEKGGLIKRLPRLPCTWSGKRIIALVDAGTASASEVLLGCLQAHGVLTLFGERTRGKGIAQAQVPLANGYALSITRARWYLPTGAWLGDAGMTVAHGLVPERICSAVDALGYAVNELR